MAEQSGKADHLCILVHGLWGSPKHLKNVAEALRNRYSDDQVHVLVAERNSGSFTYDGIELGGERVCHEIEEEVARLAASGRNVTKLSLVGYSLGGLVARYAIGLLESKGIFERIEPINFTAFASPFLGVRSPLKSWVGKIFNVLGPRTLSMSGRQLFAVDEFRGTGRPLLSILAEPNSTFIQGLQKFKRRTLYSNIVNDRTSAYFTTGISRTDPFVEVDKLTLNYAKGYDNVVLDLENPIINEARHSSALGKATQFARTLPFRLALVIIIPIGVTAFLINAVVQTFSSNRRIKLHEAGKAGIDLHSYRSPFINEIREAVEDVYENINNSQSQEYLTSDLSDTPEEADDKPCGRALAVTSLPKKQILALSDVQFDMIDTLDKVGLRKNLVHIHKTNHSHAAIVARIDKPAYDEGHQVLKHWLDNEFLLE